MTHKHTYDDQGLATSYLLLSILFPVLMYFIYRQRQVKHVKCSCSVHRKRNKPISVPYAIIAIVIIMSVLLYNVCTIKLTRPTDVLDPYTILGIDESANKKEIRAAYRKLLRENDPDKHPDRKDELSLKMADINNAYGYLTHPKKRKQSFNKVESEIVAIPQRIVDNGKFVFLIYIGLIAILFPWFGISKWRKSVGCNSLGVNYKSVETFYKKMDTLLARDIICSIRNIMHLICESEEMKSSAGGLTYCGNKELQKFNMDENDKDNKGSKDYDKDRKLKMFVKHYIENNYGYPVNDGKPIKYYILLDHLFRSEIFTSEVRAKVAEETLSMIAVLKRIALVKDQRELVDVIFTFGRMVMQCVCDPSYSILQYPNIYFEDVFTKNNISKEDIDIPRIRIKSVCAYVAKNKEFADSEPEDEEELAKKEVSEEGEGKLVEPEELKGNTKIFKIEKESLVTVKITLERVDTKNTNQEDYAFMLKMKGENDIDMLNAMGHTVKTPVHTPYSDLTKYVQWECLYALNGRMLKKNTVLADFVGERDVFIEFDSTKGSSKLEINVKNDQYFGVDVSDEIAIEYI